MRADHLSQVDVNIFSLRIIAPSISLIRLPLLLARLPRIECSEFSNVR